MHTIFRLTKDAERLNEIQADQADTVSNLESELAIARLLLEQATNNGQLTLATQLLKAIAVLCTARDAAREKQGLLISRDKLERYAERLVQIVVEEINQRPGFEDVIDGICTRVPEALQ